MDIFNFTINYQLVLSVVGTILCLFLLFLILQFIWLRTKVNRLYKKYKYFAKKFRNLKKIVRYLSAFENRHIDIAILCLKKLG